MIDLAPAARSLPRLRAAGTRPRRALPAAGAVALSAGLAWALGACSASDCSVGLSSNPVAVFRGGSRYAADGAPVPEGGGVAPAYYETSAPDGEHLPFGGGARLCIRHDLGRRPFTVDPWVSFSRTGTLNGNEAKPAGNMLEVLHVDECVIIVRNDSCGEYFLRMTASAPVTSDAAAPPVACNDEAVDRCIEPDEPFE